MLRSFAFASLVFIASQVNAQIGVGPCQWQSDGTAWRLIACNPADRASDCIYPNDTPASAVQPGLTIQRPMGGPNGRAASAPVDDRRLPLAVGGSVLIAGLGVSFYLSRKGF